MKNFTGTVISNKMQKTVAVLIEYMWQHPIYKKTVKRSKKYLAHTDQQLNIGDRVVITEHPPISKSKRWIVSQVIAQATESK